jgi:eukaryotic-like serine/threonine-protein kinase
MLTGRRAFAGATAPDVLEAVVKEDPDWSKLSARTPAYLRRLLERCLAKDRRQRLQAIGDWRLLEATSPELNATAPSHSRLSWISATSWAAFATAFAALFAGVALWAWLKPAAPTAKPVTRFSMTLPGNMFGFGSLALSRDGSLLAVAGGTGKPLYLRRMDQLEARALPGTEGAGSAAFSPDGQWIAYNIFGNPGSLKKLPVAGGAALTLVEGIALGGDLDWGLDDNIYFSSTAELLRVSSNGGKPQTLLTADPKKGELQYGSPQLLPGGKEVLVGRLTTKGLNLGQIVALNLQTGETKTLLEGSLRARYAATGAKPESGYLVYGLNGALLAVPFEVNGLKAGSPVPVLEGVAGIGPVAEFGFSDSGTLAYGPGSPGDPNALGNATIVWVDRQGKEQPIPAPPRAYVSLVELSPDNGRVALAAADLQRLTADLWVYDLARGNQPRITFEGSNVNPIWTPDGKRLIYSFSRDVMGQQNPEIRSVPADSSGPPTTLLATEAPPYVPDSVSPDGKLLMGIRNKAGAPALQVTAGDEIWVLPLDASNPKPDAKPRAFVESQAQFIRDNPQFSPDGNSVAYQANDSGRNEIYVVPYPGPGGRQQASTDGGTAPRWSRNGRELFYRNGDKMMAVDVQTTPSFHVTGTPKMLFEKSGGYDVSADGKRFLMVRQGAPAGQSNQINVVLNWFEELRRRAPVGK